MRFAGKTVVLCVTGGIAAYKAADLTSKLHQNGATVHVLMTESATQFIAPMTFETLSGQPRGRGYVRPQLSVGGGAHFAREGG